MDGLISDFKKLGYTNVQEVTTDNGTGYYMIKSNGSGAVYLPPDANNATAVVGLYPGMGASFDSPQSGVFNYQDYINGTVKTGSSPDGTIIVFADAYGGDNSLRVPNAVDTAINNGAKITNVGVMTFSGSGQTGMYAAGIVANEHEGMKVTVLNADAYTHNYQQSVATYNGDESPQWASDLQRRQKQGVGANIDGKVTVINFIPDGNVTYENIDKMRNDIQYMAENGHNTLIITSNSKNHGQYRIDFLKAGGVDFLAGKGELDLSYFTGVQKYDQATGQWVDSDINEMIKNGYTIDVADPNELRKIVAEQGGGLREFANSYGVRGGEDTLASNLCFVSQCVDKMSSKPNVDPLSGPSDGFTGSFFATDNYFIGISNGVNSAIKGEMAAIYLIANSVYGMDRVGELFVKDNLATGSAFSAFERTPERANLLTESNQAFKNGMSDYLSTAGTQFSLATQDFAKGLVGNTSVSDLNYAMNITNDTFHNMISDSKQMLGYITDLQSSIGNGKVLSGGIWNDVSANMDYYNQLLMLEIDSANILLDATKVASEMVAEAIESAGGLSAKYKSASFSLGGESIDDTQLDDIESTISNAQNDLNKLKETAQSLEDSYTTWQDEKGNWYESPSRATISAAWAAVNECQGHIDDLKAIKEAIVNYQNVCKNAKQMIEDALNQVRGNFENAAECLAKGQTFTTNFSLNFAKYGVNNHDAQEFMNKFDNRVAQIQKERAQNDVKKEEALKFAESKAREGTSNDTSSKISNSSAGTNWSGSTGGGGGYSGGGGSKPNGDTSIYVDSIKTNEQPSILDTSKPNTLKPSTQTPNTSVPKGNEDVVIDFGKEPKTPTSGLVSDGVANGSRRIESNGSSVNNVSGLANDLDTSEFVVDAGGIDVEQPAIIEIVDNSLDSSVESALDELKPIDNTLASKVGSDNNGSVVGKAAGVIGGVGLATGVGAYATNKMIRDKELEEGYNGEAITEDDLANEAI